MQQPTRSGLHVAESIAFYNGEHRESAIAGRRLAVLVATTRLKIRWEAVLSLWTNCYSYATVRCCPFSGRSLRSPCNPTHEVAIRQQSLI